jgi:hypothetical protein
MKIIGMTLLNGWCFFGCLSMIQTNVRKEVWAQNDFSPCKKSSFSYTKETLENT